MSWATCFSGSNNIHFDFPPIMSDGRNFASWQPEAVINKQIQKTAHITNNWNYRQYLQNNGIEIMRYNNSEYCADLGLPNHNSSNESTNVPYLYTSTFDRGKPNYGYNSSDLKNPYLTREQLNARMIAPSIQVKNT